MWVEEITIENVRCFNSTTLRFVDKNGPRKWVTLLGENGGGKSTILQALALLLAGPEGAQKLLPRPIGWLKDESSPGKISARIHQSSNDPGTHGTEKIKKAFGYSFHITGTSQLTIRNKRYTEPGIHESPDRTLSWLRENAFPSQGSGWFAVGYGAFRRLTRSSQIIVPSLEPQARFTNFLSQFNEDEPLSAFERWMTYLDYRIVKSKDKTERQAAKQKRELGISAINKLLPVGVRFSSVTTEGRIIFDVNGRMVPTIALSDGYRSILALAGDIVWRLIQAFPNSENALKEEGVVLIDELDIHLHPQWQREIAGWLQMQFPNLQFIVATHSPLVAAGAGDGALTLQINLAGDNVDVRPVRDISALRVDRILQSEAFNLVSPYSPQTQNKIDRYDVLASKGARRQGKEKQEFNQLSLFLEEARPFAKIPDTGSFEDKLDTFLKKRLK